jgi:hypothetical protein
MQQGRTQQTCRHPTALSSLLPFSSRRLMPRLRCLRLRLFVSLFSIFCIPLPSHSLFDFLSARRLKRGE